MKNIIVIGGGGHAKVVISILRKIKAYNLIGYTDLEDKGNILSIPYLGKDTAIFKFPAKNYGLVLGIGQIGNASKRKELVRTFMQKQYQFMTIVSPDSIINEDTNIGTGTVIMDGTVLNSGTDIGCFCIINTRSSIDHDCSIEDFVHIAPGAIICGDVSIGEGTFVGAGTVVVNGCKIEKDKFIKASSLVK